MLNPYARSSNRLPPQQPSSSTTAVSSTRCRLSTPIECDSPCSSIQNPYASGASSMRESSPVVKNSYMASPSSSTRSTIQQQPQKRTQRPWEEKSLVDHEKDGRPRPTKTSNVAADPFDDGFDWSSALGSIDAVATTSTAGQNNLNQQLSQGQTTTHRNSTQDAEISSRPVTSYQKPGGGSAPPPDLLPKASKAKTLASVLPDCWLKPLPSSNDKPLDRPSSGRAARKAAEAAAPHPYGDERQVGLPKSLQFDTRMVQPVEDDNFKTLMAHANLSATLKNGWTLFPHQARAIKQSLQVRRCILALDMGLGKTVIGCIWARSFLSTSLLRCKRAFVLCPVSLQQEWTRTAEDAAGLTVVDTEAKPPKPKNRGKKKKDVIDDDDASDDESEQEKPVRSFVTIHSWAKLPDPPDQDNFVVVADEAHSMQNMASARTKSTLSLVLHERCIGVLLLTGTPMKNGKPSNLFPLLRAIRHPLGRHQRDFESRFCQGREITYGKGTRPVWQANGSAHLDQLRVLTQSHMLHLTKEACLEELPPRTRIFEQVPVSSRQRIKHDQALQELARIHKSCKEKKGATSEAVLGAVQNLRMIGSLAKVDATVRYAKKILGSEPAIVIFTNFVEVAKQVHQRLADEGWEGELLTGETKPKNRQAMVDSFQSGLSPTFVCTFGAGGVGLTLTAARTVILLDRPWTPGDAHQAEDRVRRIGQTHPVKSVWMRAFEIDQQLDDMIAHKTQTCSAVLQEESGNGDSATTNASAHISILKLLAAILPETTGTNILMKQTSMLQFSQPVEEN